MVAKMYITFSVEILLFLLISGCSSQVVIQFFLPDQNATNVVGLECIADGLPQAGATFQFFSDLDETTLQSTTKSETADHLVITVEHTSEQFVRCVFNGETSNFLAIAGTWLALFPGSLCMGEVEENLGMMLSL